MKMEEDPQLNTSCRCDYSKPNAELCSETPKNDLIATGQRGYWEERGWKPVPVPCGRSHDQ